MKRRFLGTAAICFLTLLAGGAFTIFFLGQAESNRGPLILDEKAMEVRFNATLKKPEHPAGYDPAKLATPNALVNEQTGTALLAAGLVADEGVTAEKLAQVLEKLLLKAGRNIALDEVNKTAIGDPVNIFIDTGSKRFLVDDVLKAALPTAKTNFIFLGNVDVQKKMRCGCLICGRSGPGTVLANSEYKTGEPALIGPTLHAGLLKMGLKDKDKVTIIISKK